MSCATGPDTVRQGVGYRSKGWATGTGCGPGDVYSGQGHPPWVGKAGEWGESSGEQERPRTCPDWSSVLLVSFSLRKCTACFIQWLPRAGESGWMYVTQGGCGSDFPATPHWSLYHCREREHRYWEPGPLVTQGQGPRHGHAGVQAHDTCA